jgi:tetrahydromethanopterin S-methyltransferase subunit A
MVVLAVAFRQDRTEVGADVREHIRKQRQVISREYLPSVLGDKDQVDMECEHARPTSADVIVISHRPMVL